MAKEELLEFDGTVTEVLPDGNFRVKLDNEHEVLAYTAGKMRKFRIRTGVGDRVIVEMSPYDLQRGRISFRHKGDAPTPARSNAGRTSAGGNEVDMSRPRWPGHFLRLGARIDRWSAGRAMKISSHSASRAGDRSRRRIGSAAQAPQARKTSRRTPRSTRPAKACCGCCRPTPSPSIPSTRPAASSPIRRPPARCLLRPVRRAKRVGVLHRLCRQEREREPAADLRVQRRTGRGFRLPASRPGRPAHSRSRAGRPRRRDARNCATIPTPGSPSPTWC